MTLVNARAFFDTLNHDYVAVHRTKEELFWTTYMGTSSDDEGFTRAERAFKDFVSDPARLAATREQLAHVEAQPPGAERNLLLHGLRGWQALFEANVIESDEGRRLMHELVEAESALFAKRRTFVPTHVNERGEVEDATLASLATNLATNPVEERRRSSFDAFRGIEQWALDNGFLELVRLRNRFARALGYRDFFEMKLRKSERMTTDGLFVILDDFLERTDAANARTLAALRSQHGDAAVLPWNLRFFTTGDIVRRMDPYLTFAPALRRWVESFRAPRHRFPWSHAAARPAGPRRQVPERLLSRAGAGVGERTGRMDSGPDQFHVGGQTRSGRERHARHRHAVP